MLVSLFTDASFCQQTHVGGWGAWAKSERGQVSSGGIFKENPPNSHVAEFWAVVNGLHTVIGSNLFQNGDKVLIQTDCMEVVHALTGVRRFRSKKDEIADLQEKIDAIAHANNAILIPRHVKAHTKGETPRLWINNKCDKIARQYMLQARAALP